MKGEPVKDELEVEFDDEFEEDDLDEDFELGHSRGAERAGLTIPALRCAGDRGVGKPGGYRRIGECLRRIEAVSAVADQELGLVGQDRPADPDEHPVRALEVGDDPAVQAADELVRDLDMPRRDPAVERDAQVALGAADDEPMIADADDLAVGLAVVEDGQQRERAAAPWGGRAGRLTRGAAWGGPSWCILRGGAFRHGLFLALRPVIRLTNFLVGLDQRTRTFDMGVRLPGRDGWDMGRSPVRDETTATENRMAVMRPLRSPDRRACFGFGV